MINLSNFKNQWQSLKKESYNEIYRHELAHKNAIGNLGGPIVIKKDKNGIAFEGHVEVKMPVLNPDNPDETIQHAKKVINSALAPSNPSNQDYKVAHEAQEIMQRAQDIKNGSKLNYLA